MHRRLRDAQALGTQPDLRRGFLAGKIHGAAASIGERGGHLQQQRRFADARLAADQQRRARHQSAAGHPVELGDAGEKARRLVGGGAEGFEEKCLAPVLRFWHAGRRRGAKVGLLDQRVPALASRALPRPARRDAAAGLADISR